MPWDSMDPALTSPLLPSTQRQSPLYAVEIHPTGHVPPEHRRETACLDVFAGLCILALIVSQDLSDRYPALGHAPWDGARFGDFIVPCFLVLVGARVAQRCHVAHGPPSSALHQPSELYQVVLQAVQLFLLGVFLQGGFFHQVGDLVYGVSITNLRIFGFLQRLAVALLLVGLCHVAVSQRESAPREGDCCALCSVLIYHWQAALLVVIAYLSLTFLLYVPDWELPLPLQLSPAGAFGVSTKDGLREIPAVPSNVSSLTVPCGVSGDLSPACNAAAYIDRALLGLSHLYGLPTYRNLPECVQALGKAVQGMPVSPAWCLAPFEPSGLLSTLGGVLPAFIGLHFGHILIKCEGHGARLAHTVPLGGALLLCGWLLQFPFRVSLADILQLDSIPSWAQINSPGIPWNLSLLSTSFALLTSGIACLLLAALYLLVDVARVRFYTRLLEWSGKNWLFLYSMVVAPLLGTLLSGFYWETPENNLITALQNLLMDTFHDADAALIVGVVLKVLLCGLVSGALQWQGVTWSV